MQISNVFNICEKQKNHHFQKKEVLHITYQNCRVYKSEYLVEKFFMIPFLVFFFLHQKSF